MTSKREHVADILIVGAGAAGLMAGIWAGRTAPDRSIVVVDSAVKLGAKILVSGGARCNVTHDEVTPDAFAGSSRHAIKKVLSRFGVPQTVAFFRELGVELKREETGKLFPITDSARTVRDALLAEINRVGVTIDHPWRVDVVREHDDCFVISGASGERRARRVILATGGKSLPKTGSDGHGYAIAASLGHTLTSHIFPALVPLTLPPDHFIRALSGITIPASLELWSSSGKKLSAFTDSTLCTHFGLSGPSVLDMSRYYNAARLTDPGAQLTINWLPAFTLERIEAELLAMDRTSPLHYLGRILPERLVRALCREAGVDPGLPADRLTREARKKLAITLTRQVLPITGDRGFNAAEVTAGGVPLNEIRLETMESRVCPGLYLCGEICDVDGRIGGYNFQWAWSSGYVAGAGAAS